MPSEEYAIVLDYLSEGRVDSATPGYKREKRIAQVVGEEFFSLLEVSLREEQSSVASDRLYIGKSTREKVHHIIRKLNYKELTSTARVELDFTLDKLVKEKEELFVKWFNECGSLTTRLHRLELLPGVGKKHMWEITDIRKTPFTSYEDIAKRVKLLPEPQKLIIKRIIWELQGEDDKKKQIKYKIFVGVPLSASGEQVEDGDEKDVKTIISEPKHEKKKKKPTEESVKADVDAYKALMEN
jgi:putative nucleotide binding protein|tara:strand:+ start:2157 stop:2879 length:723 start_codon:yes stop_codon:yes gene_type:complete